MVERMHSHAGAWERVRLCVGTRRERSMGTRTFLRGNELIRLVMTMLAKENKGVAA